MVTRYLNKTDAPIKAGSITIQSFDDYRVSDSTASDDLAALDSNSNLIKYVDGVIQKPVVQKVIAPKPEPIITHAPSKVEVRTTSFKK